MDYNARWYDAGLGRFTQPDTIVQDLSLPQTLNKYSYVLGNPILFSDPSGHGVPPPICIIGCDQTWLDYSGVTGFINGVIDVVATIGCFVVPTPGGCNVDTTLDRIDGPSTEDYFNESVAGLGNPLAVVGPSDDLAESATRVIRNLLDNSIAENPRKANIRQIEGSFDDAKRVVEDISIPGSVNRHPKFDEGIVGDFPGSGSLGARPVSGPDYLGPPTLDLHRITLNGEYYRVIKIRYILKLNK